MHCWEIWQTDKRSAIIHYGQIGTIGETETIKSGIFSSLDKKIDSAISNMVEQGYSEIDEDEQIVLLVEYKVDGMGTDKDVEKRRRLQDHLQGILGWNGLGFCDGGSIGSGTMEACCYVVDIDLSKKIIKNDLKNTEFNDYIRIYEE